jgi:hypothetical protein
MYHLVWLVTRKIGFSHQQFRDYYEANHRVMAEEGINGFALGYERHFLYPLNPDGPAPIYDAVTHLSFSDRAAFERLMDANQRDPERGRKFYEDEEKFMEHLPGRQYVADDYASELQPVPAGDDLFRAVMLARRRPDLTPEQFAAYYENKHRLLGEYIMNGLACSYERRYLRRPSPDAPAPHFDVLTEVTYPSRANFEQVIARLASDPALGRLIAEDEARFMDRDSAVSYRAELSRSVLGQAAANSVT